MPNHLGDYLVFLVSQPRAGSTLLQRILASHPDLHTISEPWLMLHPFYALRSEGYQAEYGERLARRALEGFLQALPAKDEEYFEGVRRMAGYLYDRARTGSGAQLFLDKTPRYYFIIPELCRTFPQARSIILLRNPLAVLCSILDTWVQGNWFFLAEYRHDLLEAPRCLVEGVRHWGDQGLVVHYEALVHDPDTEIRRICDHLGLSFRPEMVEYGRTDVPRWAYGDPETVHHHTRPVPIHANKWEQALANPQIWRLARDYWQALGPQMIGEMGYSYQELGQILAAHRPAVVRLWSTHSLTHLLGKPIAERPWWRRGLQRVRRAARL